MVLSADSSFLIVDSFISTSLFLNKIDSSNGAVLST